MQTNEHRNHRVHTLFDEDRRQPDKKGEEQAAEMGHGREVEELQAGSCERGAGRSMDAGEMLTNLFFYRCYSVHSQPNAVGRAVGCGRRCSQYGRWHAQGGHVLLRIGGRNGGFELKPEVEPKLGVDHGKA